MTNITKVALVLKPKHVHEFNFLIPGIIRWLQRRSKSVIFSIQEKERIESFMPDLASVIFLDEKKYLDEADLIISLGGDGTLIGIARQSTSKTPPIFGINLGHLGFITEFSKLDFYDHLEKVFHGELNISKLFLCKVDIIKNNKVWFSSRFLNDAVVSKNSISRMFTISTSTKNEHIFNVSGDGLIISTPVGSTAYSLAAGGPILHPSLDAFVITPICPHGLTHRPIVLPSSEDIQIKPLNTDEPVTLTLDGQQAVNIDKWDTVKIYRDEQHFVSLVKNPERSYFHTLKEKFYHGRNDTP